MRIVGIDPGFNSCAISFFEDRNYEYSELFIEKRIPKKDLQKMGIRISIRANKRLEKLFHFVNDHILDFDPDFIGIEGLAFHPRSGKGILGFADTASGITACKIGALVTGKRVFEFLPFDLRLYCLGENKGEKQDIQNAVIDLYGMPDLSNFNKSEHEHIFDSIAVGHCTICKVKEVKGVK